MSTTKDPAVTRRQIKALVRALTMIVQNNPDCDVRGIALPVLGAAVPFVPPYSQEDLVARAMSAAIHRADSPVVNEPVRASDALIVAAVLGARLEEVQGD